MRIRFINWLIKVLKINTDHISDGYHTFGELYQHRCTMFVLLMKYAKKLGHETWYSHYHSDGARWDRWIIAGIGIEKGKQITYHLPSHYQYELERYEIIAKELKRAPDWDGHTPNDVINRMRDLILYGDIF